MNVTERRRDPRRVAVIAEHRPVQMDGSAVLEGGASSRIFGKEILSEILAGGGRESSACMKTYFMLEDAR